MQKSFLLKYLWMLVLSCIVSSATLAQPGSGRLLAPFLLRLLPATRAPLTRLPVRALTIGALPDGENNHHDQHHKRHERRQFHERFSSERLRFWFSLFGVGFGCYWWAENNVPNRPSAALISVPPRYVAGRWDTRMRSTDPNATALERAVRKGQIKQVYTIVDELVRSEQQSVLDDLTQTHNTVLSLAITGLFDRGAPRPLRHQKAAIAFCLLKAGADPFWWTEVGNPTDFGIPLSRHTLLHLMVTREAERIDGNGVLLKALIEAMVEQGGTDSLNVMAVQNCTPLMLAIHHNNAYAAALLLYYGADSSMPDLHGHYPGSWRSQCWRRAQGLFWMMKAGDGIAAIKRRFQEPVWPVG